MGSIGVSTIDIEGSLSSQRGSITALCTDTNLKCNVLAVTCLVKYCCTVILVTN
jgi:hypothetical protein